LQGQWDLCLTLLERAVDAGLDRDSVVPFAQQLAALTREIGRLEPKLQTSRLDILVALRISYEVGIRRNDEDFIEGLLEALVELDEVAE
jgi:hypothetical protein